MDGQQETERTLVGGSAMDVVASGTHHVPLTLQLPILSYRRRPVRGRQEVRRRQKRRPNGDSLFQRGPW